MATPYSDDERAAIFERVCDRIARGELVSTAAQAEGVNPATIWKWANASESLGKMYARAKHDAADALADEALEVARAAEGLRDAAAVQAARLRVDTLKWAAAKRRPKEYGDRVDVTSDGRALVSAVIALPVEELPPVVAFGGVVLAAGAQALEAGEVGALPAGDAVGSSSRPDA